MQFEIVNPSDPYTMTAPDLEIAAVAGTLLGNGAYPLTALGDDAGEDVPPFIFGRNPDEWFSTQFGSDFESTVDRVLDQRNEELALAFESVTLQREKRTSLNDIGAQARDWADTVRSTKGSNAKVEAAGAASCDGRASNDGLERR